MINSLHSTTNNAESSQWFGWVSIWTESKLRASLYVMCVISKWPENTVVKSLFCFLHNRLPSISLTIFNRNRFRLFLSRLFSNSELFFSVTKHWTVFPEPFDRKLFASTFRLFSNIYFPFPHISQFILLSCIIFPSAFSDKWKRKFSFQEEKEIANFKDIWLKKWNRIVIYGIYLW